MGYKVFVDGQEGTTGLQIHQYLQRRPDLSILRIDPALRKDAAQRARMLNEADVAFLCLPDAAAREAVGMVENPDTCVIDTSTAHRVDPAWVYGLPELEAGQRERIRQSKRIANPGCHATALVLALRPLVDAGVLPASSPLSATSLTGYSGGGKKMIEQYRSDATGALQAPRPYALGLQHKHLPEMHRYARLAQSLSFMPVVGPYYKGLAVSIALDSGQLAKGAGRASVHRILAERYAGEACVCVHPLDAGIEGGFFDVQGSNDSNRVDLFVLGNDQNCLLVARLDNLGKGASGAAVQSMNIHLGVDEHTGLSG